MGWFTIFYWLALGVLIVCFDYYFISGRNFYGSISHKVLLQVIWLVFNALLFSCFLWCVATFSLRFCRWVVICATRSWVVLNARLERYIPNFFLPSAFDRTSHAVPTQGYPVTPAAYGDSNNAPPPIVPTGNATVLHHHVHELVTSAETPNENNRRRRIPRMHACTLRNTRSAASAAVQRTMLLENLEEQLRHVYPSLPAPTEQEEPIQEEPDTSIASAPELPATSPIKSDNDRDASPSTQILFSPVVKTESVTNVTISDENTLVLHQFPRSLTKPCLFCSGLYLETYIRLIEIPCHVVFDCLDLNGPWITFKGQKISGVKKSLEFLKGTFTDKAMVFTVHGERSAAAWSLSILIDHLCCTMECWRWEYESAIEFSSKQPRWGRICDKSPSSMSDIKASFRSRGFSELSPVEIADLISKDLSSLSIVIQNGGNCFLLGPSPTEIDCQAFAVLSQMVWGNDRCLRSKISREYEPISQYCIRLRNMLWPDWNEQSAKTLQETSTSQICKIHVNPSNNDNSFERRTESEKLLGVLGESSNLLSSPTPMNRNFRNSYYQITPTGEISEPTAAAGTMREPYSISEDEDEEAEFLYVCNKAPVKSETNLDDRAQDEELHEYGIVHENDNNNRQSLNGLLYTGQDEYFDDNLQDIPHNS